MRIADVRIGDMVLSTNTALKLVFAEVLHVPHGPNAIAASFLHVLLDSGAELRLTTDHLLLSASCDAPLDAFRLVRATRVRSGDCLVTVSGKDRVDRIQPYNGIGVYTVVTSADYIIVDDVIASPFALDHVVPTTLYRLFRLLNASGYLSKETLTAVGALVDVLSV